MMQTLPNRWDHSERQRAAAEVKQALSNWKEQARTAADKQATKQSKS